MAFENVGASRISDEFGFTPRYWTRMAAQGKIPGAWQPSGPGGAWLFNLPMMRHWKADQTAAVSRQANWTPPTRQYQKISGKPAADSPPLAEEIDGWLKAAFPGKQAQRRRTKT